MVTKLVALVGLCVVLIAAAPTDASEGRYKACYDDEVGAFVDTATDLECSVSYSYHVTADCAASFCSTFGESCSISGTGLLGCTVTTHEGATISCGPTAGGCRTGMGYAAFQGWSGTFSGTTRCTSDITAHSGMVTMGCEAHAY